MKHMLSIPAKTIPEVAGYTTMLDPAGTGGAMAIVDCVLPVGHVRPRCSHAEEDATFVVISGACEFWQDGLTSRRHAGEAVFVPRGSEHMVRVVGHAPCRQLVILTPGGLAGLPAMIGHY